MEKPVIYLLAQVSFSSLLHLSQDHSRDLLRSKCLQLTTTNVDLDVGLALLLSNLKEKGNTNLEMMPFKLSPQAFRLYKHTFSK